MSTTQALKIFEDKRIRTFWDDREEKWIFCINDIVAALTDSPDPADYFKTRRKRDKELDDFVRGSNCPTHSFISTDGKPHAVKCMVLQGIFRVIQSIGLTSVSKVSRSAKTLPINGRLMALKRGLDMRLLPTLSTTLGQDRSRRAAGNASGGTCPEKAGRHIQITLNYYAYEK